MQGMAGLGTLDTLGSRKTQYPSTRHASGYPWSYGGGMDQQKEISGARQHMVPPSFVESLKEFSPALPGIGTGLLPPQPGGGGLLGDPPKDEDRNGKGRPWESLDPSLLPSPWRDFNPPVQTDPRITPDMYTEDYDVPTYGNADDQNHRTRWIAKYGQNYPRPWINTNMVDKDGRQIPPFHPAWEANTLKDISPRIGRYKNPGTPGHEQYMDLHPALRAGIHRGFYDWSPGKWELTSAGKAHVPQSIGDQYRNPNKPYDPNMLFNRGGQQPIFEDNFPINFPPPAIAPPPEDWATRNPLIMDKYPGPLGQQQGGGGILGNV
jgi:hypothetical protein